MASIFILLFKKYLDYPLGNLIDESLGTPYQLSLYVVYIYVVHRKLSYILCSDNIWPTMTNSLFFYWRMVSPPIYYP